MKKKRVGLFKVNICAASDNSRRNNIFIFHFFVSSIRLFKFYSQSYSVEFLSRSLYHSALLPSFFALVKCVLTQLGDIKTHKPSSLYVTVCGGVAAGAADSLFPSTIPGISASLLIITHQIKVASGYFCLR